MIKYSSHIKLEYLLLFFTVLIFLLLNAIYFNFKFLIIARWIFPFLLFFIGLRKKIKLKSSYGFILLFSLATIPSILISDFFNESLFKYLSFIFIYVCLNQYLSKTDELDNCLIIFFKAIILFHFLNLIFVILGLNYDAGRARGFTTNANTLGVYSNLAFWSFIIIFSRRKKYNRSFIILFFLLASTILTSLASGSRTAFVVSVLNIFLYLVLCNRKFLILLIPFFIILPFIINPELISSLNITALNRLAEEGGTARSKLWDSAFNVLEGYKYFGVGYAVSKYYNYIEPGMAFHNSYISLLVDTGYWGAISLITFIFIFLLRNIYKIYIINNNIINNCLIENHVLIVVSVCFILLDIAISAWGESFLFAVGSTEGFIFWFLFIWLNIKISRYYKIHTH